ncbi:uncharacterized protein A1O9_08281 [Exophiala aquamarina CBS 119918]|uniref:Uncharacterized protein n=1 Tax=Exophiala aquamarina CBS 119918 TaxID=1182545 RepID=A0A072P6N5_9EURO|nr:uncharacterized protein A1O9_08281 [Exophiala aquamarina CBS 119918]KEF55531.1 hypothetical protein A1O9_08281 [Exophiala aquamarina CBS 119918]
MAKSVDDLIEFLLEEIALSGSRGASINELSGYVRNFYNGEDALRNNNQSPPPFVSVDKALLSKIWTWLGRHSDVSIGNGKKYNNKSLSEVESEYPGYLDDTFPGLSPEAEDNDELGGANKPLARASKESNPGKRALRSVEGPRIAVNEYRMYHAICGHPPDVSKVTPLEFVLLSHIAAARSAGILQGALGRASGQDKRSVPKRTNDLQERGYITKEAVYAHGTKTSRLILRKLAAQSPNQEPLPFDTTGAKSKQQSIVRDVVRRIFDELSNQNIIPLIDLAQRLDMSSPAKSAVLTKVIRRLDRVRLVKRVKTAFGPSASAGDLEQCLQLVQLPVAGGLDGFDTDELTLGSSIAELASTMGNDERLETALQATDNADRGPIASQPLASAQWNPGRLMTNMLRDAVQLTGTEGLTNADARKVTTGVFIRRTVEALLHRISCRSLLVQPSHLKHLAVVRIYVTIDGIAQFYYYSWEAFCELAHDKVFDISNVPGAKQVLKGLPNTDDGPIDPSTSTTTDWTGFPVRKPPFLQMERGEIDLTSIIRSARVVDVLPRNGEPVIVETEPGKFGLARRGHNDRVIGRASKFQHALMRSRQSGSMEPSSRSQAAPKPSDQSISSEPPSNISEPPKPLNQSKEPRKELTLGRPRKFMRGTEKFWQRLFKQASLEARGTGNARASRTGTMNHPAGLALFASRPPDFDETLIEAIDAHLPVPAEAQDIDEDWVHAIKDILGRSSDGVFVSPKGLLSTSARQQSQVLIFRSSRLKDVDFVDRTIVHPFRFISTSVSHSSPYQRFYPSVSGSCGQGDLNAGKVRNAFRIGRQKTAKHRSGPQKGVFYEERHEAELRNQLPSLPSDLREDLPAPNYDETTDDEVQIGHSRREIKGTPPPQPSMNGAHKDKENDRASTTIQQVFPTTTPARARPSRNRKRTEKAVENSINPWISVNASLSAEISHVERTLPLTGSKQVQPAREESAPLVDTSTEEVVYVPTRLTASPSNHDIGRVTVNTTTVPRKVADTRSIFPPSMFPDVPGSEVPGKSSAPTRESSIAEFKPTNRSEPNETVTLETLGLETDLPATRRSAQHKRRRRRSSAGEGTNSEEEYRRPRKGQKEATQKYTAGSINLCQKIVLHLLSETEGAAPNDAFTLRRIASPIWKEAGFGEAPLRNTVKQAVKYLCQRGKLRQTMFSFRGKSGLMVQRAIIYLPTIRSTSDLVEKVKRKVIECEPADYIPPEWANEGAQLSLFEDRIQLSDIVGKVSRRRQTSMTRSDGSAGSMSERDSRSPTRPPSPLPPAPPAGPSTGFVTLKAPKLGTLFSVQVENWRSELGRALELASAAAFTERRERSTRSRGLLGRDRPIKWANKDVQDFPSSLLDVLMITPAKQLHLSVDVEDRNWHRFAAEIEAVEAWEQKRSSAAQNSRTSYGFISHSIPAVLLPNAMGPRNVEFSKLIHFDESGIEVEVPFPDSEPWPPFVSALAEKDVNKTAIIAEWSRGNLSLVPSEDEDARQLRPGSKRKTADDDVDFRHPTKRRRKGWKQASAARRAKAVATRNPHTGLSYFARGVQYLRDLSLQQVQRLALSVIVVRTLAGGLEGFIDWPIVMALFPSESEDVIRGRWKTISTKYRGDVNGLTSSLQVKYLDALEADQVPCVNFADLKATNWHGIVEWASDNLNRFDSERIDELPADKASFMEANDFSFAEPRCMHNLLTYGNNITSNAREETVSAIVFGSNHSSSEAAIKSGLNLEHKPLFEVEISDAALRLAKSWVLASILTTDAGFDPEVIRWKLAGLAPTPDATDDLLYRALGVLQDEKLVQKTNNNQKLVQGASRGIWEPAKKLYERFEERRMITAGMLRRAFMYKLEVLDAAFARGEVVTIQKTGIIDDGAMVAVLNLIANGMVKASPGADVPRTRYGLDWENVGYKTREMDKKLLEFNVNLVQTEDYTFGDMKQAGRSIPIPRGDADKPMGHIPPWLDIHGRFQSNWWETFVAGVLGLVVQLPGIGARDISRTLGFALDEGEVGLLMGWCVDAGFATIESRSGGYETTCDWWLCISNGNWPWGDCWE